ncbi:MAG TPA: hypothetical protein V6C88_09070 [Chroococcidiopsis sp.]
MSTLLKRRIEAQINMLYFQISKWSSENLHITADQKLRNFSNQQIALIEKKESDNTPAIKIADSIKFHCFESALLRDSMITTNHKDAICISAIKRSELLQG